jgi:hypothetical protein
LQRALLFDKPKGFVCFLDGLPFIFNRAASDMVVAGLGQCLGKCVKEYAFAA